MDWEELHALFADTLGDTLPAASVNEVARLVAALDVDAKARAITAAFRAAPGWPGDGSA
jgi:hypothetical protein